MTVALSSFETVPPALALAVLVTEPLLRSAWVIEYEAVQVIDSPGSRKPSWLPIVLKAGQLTVALSSATVTGPARRTLPLLRTRYVYEITSPMASAEIGEAVLSSKRLGLWTAVTVALSSFESIPPALAFAVFVTEPAFRSACVTEYEAVQVTASSGSRNESLFPTVSRFGQLTVALSSATVTGPAKRTLPVFSTR